MLWLIFFNIPFVGIASVWCGMACGRRNIPIGLGIICAVVAGIVGLILRGTIGCFALPGVVAVLFSILPIPRDQEEDDQSDGSHFVDAQRFSDRDHQAKSTNPYAPSDPPNLRQ